MKKTAIAFIVAACFVGVLGALQVDHLMVRHEAGSQLAFGKDFHLQPADYTTGTIQSPVDFRAAAKKVVPSVVSIDQFQRVGDFFNPSDGTLRETGQGSGVIVSSDGLIVTNNHVVTSPETGAVVEQVKVRTGDKKSYLAKVIGHDPRSDLAVLKIDAKNLTPIELGDSGNLDIGQWVLAVGNPLGFDNTVSVGVVSSLNRTLPIQGSFLIGGIQTDAAINPGNSGGALTDAQGRLIGINSAIASGNGGSVGIGFAIPVNRVRKAVDDIVKFGYVKYGTMGVSYSPRYDGLLGVDQGRQQFSQVAGAPGAPNHGVIVKSPYRDSPSVAPGSPADKAGVHEYDVILKIDGEDVNDSMDLNRLLTTKNPGQQVKLTFWDKGETKTVNLTLVDSRPTL